MRMRNNQSIPMERGKREVESVWEGKTRGDGNREAEEEEGQLLLRGREDPAKKGVETEPSSSSMKSAVRISMNVRWNVWKV